jgi:hypothetical protein
MGPDDPEVLKDLFWDEPLGVPHLWDAERRIAGPYGLGFQHLGIFIVDRAGIIRAMFDDRVPNAVDPIVPAVREALASPAPDVSRGPPVTITSGIPVMKIDGRTKLLSTNGARVATADRPPDTGLFGEELENGTIFLFRWELRWSWSIAPGVEFEPLLRISNEPDEVLTEGAERVSSRYGTASLRARRGPISATLGGYRARVSPLLMQRWDELDAPPVAGLTGCGVCGAGASALQQRSLEVLDPEYLLEGVSAAYTHRYGRLSGSIAVPIWEVKVKTTAPFEQLVQARYRQILSAGALDIGPVMRTDTEYGLPRPVGLRLGVVSLDDDQRSLPHEGGWYSPPPRDEIGWVALARVGPWWGFAADGEFVDWTVTVGGRETDAEGYRAGVVLEREFTPVSLEARAHRIYTDRFFEPHLRALTYEGNREGWRFAARARLLGPEGGTRERLGVTFFLRDVEETEGVGGETGGGEFGPPPKEGSDVLSLAFSGRPIPDLLAEVGLLRARTHTPIPPGESGEWGEREAETTGATIDVHWEGWPALDPGFHLEILESDPTGEDPETVWQLSISVGVTK